MNSSLFHIFIQLLAYSILLISALYFSSKFTKGRLLHCLTITCLYALLHLVMHLDNLNLLNLALKSSIFIIVGIIKEIMQKKKGRGQLVRAPWFTPLYITKESFCEYHFKNRWVDLFHLLGGSGQNSSSRRQYVGAFPAGYSSDSNGHLFYPSHGSFAYSKIPFYDPYFHRAEER